MELISNSSSVRLPDSYDNVSSSEIYENGSDIEHKIIMFAKLCHEPFWDRRLAWDTSSPELGFCLERTVLLWGPCGFLWVLAPFYVFRMRLRAYSPIPRTALFCAKLILLHLLIFSAVAELIWSAINYPLVTAPKDILASVVLLVTHIIQVYLVYIGRLYGERSSGILWMFWFLVLLCGIPQVITSINYLFYEKTGKLIALVATFAVHYSGSIMLFISNCFCDAPTKLERLTMTQKSNPELSASFPNRLMCWWCFPIIWLGWKRPIIYDDLWDVHPDYDAKVISKQWREDISRYKKLEKEPLETKNDTKKKEVFLLRRLWSISSSCFISCFFYYFAAELARFLTPPLLSLLIKFVSNADEPVWHGFFYATSLLFVCEFSSIVKNKYFHETMNLALRIRTALMSAVYIKALKLSASARRENTLGEIVSLMAVDAQMIGDTCWQFYNVIGGPVIIMVSTVFLWQRLGPSVLSGLAVLVLLTPLNSYLANKLKKCRFSCMKLRDRRVKLISEIISGIKVLKLYAWEESFAKKVKSARDQEITSLRRIALLQAVLAFIFNVSPYVVALVTFTSYLLASKDNVLDAEVAFVSIALFNLMKPPIGQMPTIIAKIIQASVAFKRMKKFLSSGELDVNAVCTDQSETAHLAIHNGKFCWEDADGQASWTLHDMNLKIEHGDLVAIVGSVGAGKSSLISAILGEIKKETGTVIVNGSIAYVSQESWLQNDTLRNNVTWGRPYEEGWYQEVIKACSLLPDIEIFPAGDLTEIGEKGINLSGGQKQRVSLARAVYSEADIVLLDDPLSAVDAHVGKSIFENVLGPNGLLRQKTRVLVTHAITFLPQVDSVLFLKGGRILEYGKYSDLISSDGEFAHFILQYISSNKDADEELQEFNHQLDGNDRGESPKHITQVGASDMQHAMDSSLEKCGTVIMGQGCQRELQPLIEGEKSPARSVRSFQLHQSNGCLSSKQENVDMKSSKDTQLSCSKLSLQGTRTGLISETKFMNGLPIQENSIKELKSTDKSTLVDAELMQTGQVARAVYVKYGQAMGVMFAILPVILLSLGQASVAGSNVWLSLWSTSGNTDSVESANSSTIIDDSIVKNSTENILSREVFIAGYGFFGVTQAVFIFGGMLLVMLGCLRASDTLHEQLLGSVIRLPMGFFDTNPSGRIINLFSKEINIIDNVLPLNVKSFTASSTQVIATLVVIVASTPLATVFMLPIIGIYYLIQTTFVATSRQLKRIESVTKSPIYSHFGETVQGASVIRAFKKEEEFSEKSIFKINSFLKVIYISVSANRWLNVQLETLGNLITFAAALLAVLSRDTISPGIVGLSITYALSVTTAFGWLVRVASDLEANIVSVERIAEYLQKEQEAKWRIEDTGPPGSWPATGCVSFNNYEMRYRPGLELVLKGITCTISSSEKVGIVGRTGAGKTSLTAALFRLTEAAGGIIEIDDVNIACIGLHDLRSQLSIIPQDPVLFCGTLKFNLDPSETISDADVWRSLELAHLSDYVKSLPLGLQHPVDEGGSNFSVGQKQLVCLARALLRKSRILVLDEATAAVDMETDDLIQATVRDQFKDCTVLTIAHRLNTIMDCDRILVLDQGSIAEFDTPATLLANSDSVFHSMAKDAGAI